MANKYRFYLVCTVVIILLASFLTAAAYTIEDYSKEILENPNRSWSYFNRGNIYYEEKMFDEAIADYSKAIELTPNFTQAYNNRGNAYGQKGLYDKAITDYNKAMDLSPRFGHGYVNLGYVWYLKGEDKLACFFYERACTLGYCKGFNWIQNKGLCSEEGD